MTLLTLFAVFVASVILTGLLMFTAVAIITIIDEIKNPSIDVEEILERYTKLYKLTHKSNHNLRITLIIIYNLVLFKNGSVGSVWAVLRDTIQSNNLYEINTNNTKDLIITISEKNNFLN